MGTDIFDKAMTYFGASYVVEKPGLGNGIGFFPALELLLPFLVFPDNDDQGNPISLEQYRNDEVDHDWLLDRWLRSVTTDGLCIRCAQIWKVLRKNERRENVQGMIFTPRHQGTFASIFFPRNFGCKLCPILLQCFRRQDPLLDPTSVSTVTFHIQYPSRWDDSLNSHSIQIKLYMKSGDLSEVVLNRRVRIYELPPDYEREQFQGSRSSTDPSDYRIPQAIRWKRRCEEDHARCRPATPKEPPTRLILLLPKSERLLLTKDLPLPDELRKHLEYATLSHCWGTTPFYTLQRSNLESMLTEIPRSSLTRTFKEAIDIARALDFRFIWIDSLCIIQDDDKDWRSESVRMSEIYGGSSLTIAATAAPDGSYGCLQEHDLSLIPEQTFRLPNAGTFVLRDLDLYQHQILESPLAKRAWVYQERFLSHRVLHCASQQLFWECQEDIFCETFPGRMPVMIGHDNFWFQLRSYGLAAWSDIIKQYSRCLLTRQSDKLVAIAGVAKWFGISTSDQCYAGLFKKKMEDELLWHLEADAHKSEKRHSNIAPTWSWASLDGPIKIPRLEWQGPYSRKVAHVVDYLVHSPTEDSAISTAITLRVECMGIRRIDSFDTSIISITSKWDTDEDEREESKDTYVMPVRWWKELEINFGSWAIGLILRPTHGNQRYRRVGIFYLRHKDMQSQMVQPDVQRQVVQPDTVLDESHFFDGEDLPAATFVEIE